MLNEDFNNTDYVRGFRAGMNYAEDLEDESKILDLFFGESKLEDLSPKQLKRLSKEQIEYFKQRE